MANQPRISGYLAAVLPATDGSPYSEQFPQAPAQVDGPVEQFLHVGPARDFAQVKKVLAVEVDFKDFIKDSSVKVGPTLPAKAAISRVYVDVTAAFTGGAGAKVGVSVTGVNGDANAVSTGDLVGTGTATDTIANVDWDAIAFVEGVGGPDGTAAKAIKIATAQQIILQNTVAVLTAGHAVIFVEFVESV